MPRPGTQDVRLNDSERAGILSAVCRVSNNTGMQWRRIVIFGSRVELARRGGDIDLLIEVERGDTHRFKQGLLLALEDTLGEQKIDVVLDEGDSDPSPFVALARSRGQALWTND